MNPIIDNKLDFDAYIIIKTMMIYVLNVIKIVDTCGIFEFRKLKESFIVSQPE